MNDDLGLHHPYVTRVTAGKKKAAKPVDEDAEYEEVKGAAVPASEMAEEMREEKNKGPKRILPDYGDSCG
jgi:hypothetical protein